MQRLRRRYDRAGKLLIGNHAAAWRSFDDEPVLRDQVLALHGVEIEDFVFTFGGQPQTEADWLRQLRYLDFANRHGVLTWAHGGQGALMRPEQREYVLASYLLTRRGRSVVGDLNAAKTWWPALATDLGAAAGDFYCLDPVPAGHRSPPALPPDASSGATSRARACVVNPSDTPARVALDGLARPRLFDDPAPDGPLALGPHAGRVILHDGHTASRTSSGRVER